MANKVKFGLKNVHYAVVTETADAQTGAITSTYTTPKAWKGSVSITMDPNGEDVPFYADDSDYYDIPVNNGYTGTLEVADVPEDVETDVFGYEKDATSGIVVEKSTSTRKYIALLFEFNGDAEKRRFCFYRCKLQRPSVASSTTTETVEVGTDSLAITVSPRPDDNVIKGRAYESDAAYDDWYNAVPTAS